MELYHSPGSDMLANIFRLHCSVLSQSQCLSLMSSVCVIVMCVYESERGREREAPCPVGLGASARSDLHHIDPPFSRLISIFKTIALLGD